MATTGYSETPLARKLGIKSGATIMVINPPPGYRALLGEIPAGVRIVSKIGASPAFVHVFTKELRELVKQLNRLRRQITPTGVVWVSWPKKSAGVPTDVIEDVIRGVALPLGFVDVKVCAIDGTWSGLKLVIRRANRTK